MSTVPVECLFSHEFRGRVELVPHTSRVLESNPLGDPRTRVLPVYVPPDHEPSELPLLVLLAGFTGRGQNMLETHPWRSGVVAQYDRRVAAGSAPPVLLAMPDCFTRLGGSQYVNSPAVGRYEDYVIDELVPLVEERYGLRHGRRGVCGKSSGGFGALHLAMRRPGFFRAAASISGDCCFEYGYAHDFLPATRGLLAFDSDPAAFLEAFYEKPDLAGDGHAVINLLAMSACYSPNPESALGFDLPIDPVTGARVEAVWRRWLEFDPLIACERHAPALRELDLLYLEAGRRDEFHLQFGLRRLVQRLEELDIEHEHVEFPGGHFGLDDRYLELLPKLVAALA